MGVGQYRTFIEGKKIKRMNEGGNRNGFCYR